MKQPKVHSTNYFDTFIEVAEDCPVSESQMPPQKGDKKSIANLQFEMLFENPYCYTSDDVFFKVFAIRKNLVPGEMDEQRDHFFSKGQPCFRASPLTKRYGWGIHSNADGKVALIELASEAYQNFEEVSNSTKVKAMRSKRK